MSETTESLSRRMLLALFDVRERCWRMLGALEVVEVLSYSVDADGTRRVTVIARGDYGMFATTRPVVDLFIP